MTPSQKQLQEFEQGLALIRDCLPRTWWNIYQGSIATGFTPSQAMELTQTYILAQNPHGSRPSSNSGTPQEDKE